MQREQLISDILQYLKTRKETLRRYVAGELSNLGSDDDEESLDDEAYFVMAECESKELELINAAIQRMNHGSYGICEGCKGQIPSERLEALPCTPLCISCQRALEEVKPPPTSNFSIAVDSEFAA